MRILKNVKLGKNCKIQENVIIGLPSREFIGREEDEYPKTIIGDDSLIRSGSIIYCDVIIGEKFETGHNVLIREKTRIGKNVLVGSGSIIESGCIIKNSVRIQSMVYLPSNTLIEENVFIGPNAVLTNDKYPLRVNEELKAPRIRKGATIGANAIILPGVEIGEGAFVSAGAVVTKDIPPWKLAVGSPARIKELPAKLKKPNKII